MRLILPLAALVLMVAPAVAQTTTPSSVVPPVAPQTATQKAAVQKAATPPASHRVSLDARFTKANITHDGHLTLAQAKTGYPTVAKHFTDIDATKKGFVTEDDIRAWEKAERDRRHTAQQPTTPPTKG